MAESSEDKPQVIRKRGGPGKPFTPGQSGNPGGIPKGMAELRELARTYTQEAILRLVDWMQSDNPKASPMATGMLLDRGWGKPVAAVELSGPGGAPLMAARIDLTKLDESEFRAFRELALKAKAEGSE